MNNLYLVLPVENLRNTATFFEGLNLKVDYHYEEQYIEVKFNPTTKIRFVTFDLYGSQIANFDLDVLKKQLWLTIEIENIEEMDYLLNIIRLSGGEIIEEPQLIGGIYQSLFEDYNGYIYRFTSN